MKTLSKRLEAMAKRVEAMEQRRREAELLPTEIYIVGCSRNSAGELVKSEPLLLWKTGEVSGD